MSQLFAKLYLDEDVDVTIGTLIRARAFHVTTTTEASLVGSSDQQQLEYAANNRAVLVTHNRVDFEKLVDTWYRTGKQHAGVVIAIRRSPYAIAESLLKMVNSMTADELVNQLIYI
ncbi:DUF5615 family PIN-like protein [Aeoliella mucimassa]|uniref:DUF5615 domain-containing protein n=1 Tax=Aeoliella mucimassa TaxID=2527972 RepID=A0A518AH63_9BACT|nr:DUF5615 family PIN-like protein [Aeoliella mucimassa]QDU54071.1 hypothetical protein Pan181_02510 [Aeoliella mucimassa]